MTSKVATIAILVPSLSLGGAERQALRLARLLSELEFAIHIVALSKSNQDISNEVPAGVEIHNLNLRGTARPSTWLSAFFHLNALNPDVVVGWSTHANLVACVVSRFAPWRLVVSERNYLPKMYAKSATGRLRRIITLWSIRTLYRRADVVSANSKQSVRFLKKFIGSGPDFRYMPNVIDRREFSFLDDDAPSRTLGSDALQLLAIGRLVPQKGFDILLRAVKRLSETTRCHLTIVGEGPSRYSLQSLAATLRIEGLVTWAGADVNPYPHLARAHIVVVPSRYEGFPNVLLEAMAVGKATVSADCKSGPREITCDGRFGILFPVGDQDALAAALQKLSSSEEAIRILGNLAKEHIRKTHDAEALRSYFLSFFREIQASPL